MTAQVKEVADMLEMLPEQEQNLAVELVKRIVLAWDSDFTKLTPKEAEELEEARNGEFIDEDDIDWDNLQKYA